jgi:hypothetical protein
MLENSYNSLVEELFQQMMQDNSLLEDSDVYHFFKLQTFMLEFCRLKAQAEHAAATKSANQEVAEIAKAKNLKLKQVKSIKVPFQINIQNVGISLQFTSFDFVFSSLYRRSVEKKQVNEKKISDKELHAAVQLFHQILLII